MLNLDFFKANNLNVGYGCGSDVISMYRLTMKPMPLTACKVNIFRVPYKIGIFFILLTMIEMDMF